eukprot:TRINITY_DN674_c0_g2_i2.p1 TRINITY_DN674_c0_g2~~TRINITY_DN674_c0_g2_i2.p1  ORF type:complete len:455 (+),score=171.86 TRINITY_DN674_c0_g2_i2:115-1365(+)
MAQIKVYFEQEIKSFGTSADLTLATLSQRVRRSFGVPDTSRLALKYRDEDDDWITVATEVEFTEAVNHCGSPLKLFLFVEQTNKNQVPFVPTETEVLPAPTTSTTTTTTTSAVQPTAEADQTNPLTAATGPEDEFLEKLGKQKKFLSKKEKKMLKMKIKKERKELKKARKNQKNLSAPFEAPSLGKDVCLLVSSQLSLDEKKKAATLMKDIEVMKMKKKAEVKAIKDEILQKKLELSLLKEEKRREIQTAKHQLQTLLQEAKNREDAAKKREETQPLPLTPLTPTKVETQKAETPKREKVEVAGPSIIPLTRLTPALKKEVEPEVKKQEKTIQEEKIPVSPLKPAEKSPETQTPEQKKTENAKAEGDRKVRFTDPFAEQLEALHIMGFVQSGRNLGLLKKHRGDVPSVVAELLGDF